MVRIDNESYAPIKGYVTVTVKRADGSVEELCHNKKNLLLNEGRDAMHTALYTNGVAIQPPFNFIGLSSNAAAPIATNTRTTWELIENDGTNGLGRAQATTRTHTTGTNTSILAHSFALTGQELNVQKACVLDTISTGSGIAGHENTFTNTNLEVGDLISISWTFSLG